MIDIQINLDIDSLTNHLVDTVEKKQIPFATAKALTSMAWIAKGNTKKEMISVFDRPTPFTLRSIFVQRATKKKLVASVWLKDPTRAIEKEHYLTPQIVGGGRALKRFEVLLSRRRILPDGYYTVPASGADFDRYGNMSRGQIVQIVSFFDAFSEVGFSANARRKGRSKLAKSTTRRRGISYFVVKPGQRSHLGPGIYKRINTNFGQAIKPVMIFAKKPKYRRRLDLQKIADNTVRDNLETEFSKALNEAIATIK